MRSQLLNSNQQQMAIEIERKFLVKNDSYKAISVPQNIAQGYICSSNDRVVRVRIKDDKAFITIKNATIGFSRNEWEYEIPVDEAKSMLTNVCIQPIIEKTRFVMKHHDHIWEIDEFHGENNGLVVAEIELQSETEQFEKPDFITEEVTDDKKYYNAMLFANPFSKW